MSVHSFQQWITYIYKYTCTGYAYIIDKKVHPYRQSWTKYIIDRYFTCTMSDWLSVTCVCILNLK